MQDDRTTPQGVVEPRSLRARQEEDMRAFRAYWESLCQGAEVPHRSQIDPRRIGGLLSNAFIAERIAPGVTRLRIAGLHLSDLMGMEVRGMPLSSFIAPAARERFALALVDLFERPARLEFDLRAGPGLGRPEMTGQMMLMPLRSDLGDVSRALGCLVTQGEIGRASRRFEVEAVRIRPVETVAAQVTPFDALPGGLRNENRGRGLSRGRAYLRVVK